MFILDYFLHQIISSKFIFTSSNIETANYADGTTPYAAFDNIDELIEPSEKSSKDLLTWFEGNLVKSTVAATGGVL